MQVYHCDPNWPICLYDFTFKNLCPKFVAFRVEKTLDTFLKEDHFYDINEKEERIKRGLTVEIMNSGLEDSKDQDL